MVTIYSDVSKENFAIVYSEDTAVADFATFAGGKQLDVAPTSVKVIAKRYDVMKIENRAVGFPD